MIDFYNPVKYVCKYMSKSFGINTKKMGASDYCILNESNQVVFQTDWETSDEEWQKGISLLYNVR